MKKDGIFYVEAPLASPPLPPPPVHTNIICGVTDCERIAYKCLPFMSLLKIEIQVPLCKKHYIDEKEMREISKSRETK